MDMEVLGDTGSGGTPLVDPNIDALRVQRPLHKVGRPFDECPQGCSLVGCIVKQARPTFAKCNKKVPVAVRVPVEQHKAVLISMDDKVLRVEFGMPPVIVKKTEALPDGRRAGR